MDLWFKPDNINHHPLLWKTAARTFCITSPFVFHRLKKGKNMGLGQYRAK